MERLKGEMLKKRFAWTSFYGIITLLSICLLSGEVSPEEKKAEEGKKAEELEEIVVTATRTEKA